MTRRGALAHLMNNKGWLEAALQTELSYKKNKLIVYHLKSVFSVDSDTSFPKFNKFSPGLHWVRLISTIDYKSQSWLYPVRTAQQDSS